MYYPRSQVALAALIGSIVLAEPAVAAPAVKLNPGEPLQVGPQVPDPGYPLDRMSRQIPPRGKVQCPKIAKVLYGGEVVPYHAKTYVNRPFRERLKRFERVVAQTARDVYGYAPRQIRHIGTYNCRRISLWPNLVSEHGIANGIDVSGFDFAAPKGRTSRQLPRALRRGFRVSLLSHWSARRGVEYRYHRRFLRLLAARLVQRRDIFRVLLGPGYPGHKDHFHFDVSPWRLVDL